MNTLERLSRLIEGYRTEPVPPLPGIFIALEPKEPKPKGAVVLPAPSRLGKNTFILQLLRLGFSYPEKLTAYGYMNVNRGLTLEVPLLNILQAHLPGSKIQVPLEQGGIRGFADLVTGDNEILDVKCSTTQSWFSNPGYRNQLTWYSQVLNGCQEDAYLLNYTGDIEVKVYKASSLNRNWLVLDRTIHDIMNVSVIQDVISKDNIHWVKLPHNLPKERAWQVGGMEPYYPLLYSNNTLVEPERAIHNLLRDFND